MVDFIVIPAYNEADRIGKVIDKTKQHCKNIIVVNDGSNDKTSKIAKNKGATVLSHVVNLGKGAALKTGCDYAFQQGAKRIIVLDSDGQHDPDEIPRFLESLNDKDIVFSYRKQSDVMPFVLRFGNGIINNTIKTLFGVKINDSQCGYRAFTAESYKKIRWNATDYFMETEMMIKAGKHKLRYASIPIQTIYSDNYKGTTVVDGAKIVLKMFGERFFR
jgi:glycosyltransferase involved in cell wall biosynthesis